MSFGLKNAEETYQSMMVTLFHYIMHKKIKVYVDNMIAKSGTEEDHVVNKYILRLNPAKCTLDVRSRKLLRLIVSQKRDKSRSKS